MTLVLAPACREFIWPLYAIVTLNTWASNWWKSAWLPHVAPSKVGKLWQNDGKTAIRSSGWPKTHIGGHLRPSVQLKRRLVMLVWVTWGGAWGDFVESPSRPYGVSKTMSRDVPISNPHYTCCIPGSIQFIYFSLLFMQYQGKMKKWCSVWWISSIKPCSKSLLFFTRLGNVATAASIIWIREGHDWSCWLVTWLLARDWISKLQVDHPRQQWSNDQEM